MAMMTTPNNTGNHESANNCTNLYDHRGWTQVLLPVVYTMVFIVGLSGNALALHVIRENMKKINSTTIYSANLVVSDILFALAVLFRVPYYARGFHWPLGEGLCKATALLFYINMYAGVNFMTCLSVDRFIAVVLPLRFARFRRVRNVRYICVGVWGVVMLQTLPLLSMDMAHEEPDHYITCMEYPNFEQVEGLPYMLIGAVFLGYGIPLITIIVCYSAICFKLRFMAKTNELMDKSRRAHKAIGIICGVILVFVICYSPYHIDLLQYMIRKLQYQPDCEELHKFQISLHITVCLMNLNSSLDPFIYFFACKGYKKKIMKLLKKQVSMSFSSVVKTSPEGSSPDATSGNKIHMSSRGNKGERTSIITWD